VCVLWPVERAGPLWWRNPSESHYYPVLGPKRLGKPDGKMNNVKNA
jgi:hypothetical protein